MIVAKFLLILLLSMIIAYVCYIFVNNLSKSTRTARAPGSQRTASAQRSQRPQRPPGAQRSSGSYSAPGAQRTPKRTRKQGRP